MCNLGLQKISHQKQKRNKIDRENEKKSVPIILIIHLPQRNELNPTDHHEQE